MNLEGGHVMLTMRHDETGRAPSLGRQKQGSQTQMIA